jgi:hypothetical protein
MATALKQERKLWLFTTMDVMQNITEILYLLTPAVDRSRGRYQPGDVIALILQGQFTLWGSVNGDKLEAVCVAQILNFPRARVLGLPFIGGRNMVHWLRFEKEITEWAKSQGCTQIEGYDARGGAWTRVTDWKEHYLAIGKEI